MKKQWSDNDIAEFEKVCQPVVQWLQERCDLMASAIITPDCAKLVSDEMQIPFIIKGDCGVEDIILERGEK